MMHGKEEEHLVAVIFNKKFAQLILLVVITSLMVGVLSISAQMIRPLVFIALFLIISGLVISYRERMIYLFIIYLAFIGLIRRALIPIAGWSSFDPLLILIPIFTVILAILMFWEHKNNPHEQREKPDKLMALLFGMSCIHIINPLTLGLVASMFILIPWLWYYISFFKFNKTMIKHIMNTIELLGVIIALYGLYQSFFGLLPFEMDWVNISGYAALYLAEDTVRAIGTFPSAHEFVYFITITFSISFARMIVDRFKIIHALVSITALTAIILAGSRMVIFFICLAIFMVIVITRKRLIARVSAGVIVAIGFIILWSTFPQINPAWFGSAEPVIKHVIGGLADPLSEEQTGIGHIERVVDGAKNIYTNPFGNGIASITKAADKAETSQSMSTEIDISNMIVALGLGGIIYMVVIGITIYRSIWLIYHQRQMEHVVTLGILISTLGQWLNGGFYLTPMIVWLFVGWIHKEYMLQRGGEYAFNGD